MKSALIALGMVAVLGLAAPGGLGVEASVESAEFDAFVARGFVALSGISTDAAVAVANHHGGSEYQKRIFSMTCNDKPFNGTECIGQLIINSTTVKSDHEVFYDVRYCNGKFTNKTMPKMDGNGDIEYVQICKGKNYLYMKDMKKCKETGEWMKNYYYSKSCFSKYFVILKHFPSPKGFYKLQVATYCETASETIRFDKEKEGCGSGKKGCVDIPATCNCEKTSIDEPCEGRFKIVMDKKPSSNYGRRLTKTYGHSEVPVKTKWTFTCDGKWIPYGVFYECEGMKQEYSEMGYYNYHDSRNCTGIFGASMFKEESGGYELCNGMNSFEHTMSIPIGPPTT